jgi:hypothetical protein
LIKFVKKSVCPLFGTRFGFIAARNDRNRSGYSRATNTGYARGAEPRPARVHYSDTHRKGELTMRKTVVLPALAALVLGAAGALAQSADAPAVSPPADGSLPSKAMKDSPGVTGSGTTDVPTAKPESGSLADKAMKDAPGVTGPGSTDTPTVKPESGSLSDKTMKDAPVVQ